MTHLQRSFGCCLWGRGAALTAVLLSAPGCGDEGIDMTGTLVDLHLTDTGEVTHLRDLAPLAINAYVHEGNGFSRIPPVVTADGSFTFSGLPEGEVYVHVDEPSISEVIVTSARELDLGSLYLGRPDARVVTDTAPIELDLDGLSPWTPGDALSVFSLGAGTFGFLEHTIYEDIAAGATRIDGIAEMAVLQYPMLIEGDRGDQAYLTQLETHPSEAEDDELGYVSVGRVFAPSSFSQVEGEVSSWRGSLVDVPQIGLRLDWKRSQFAALAADVHPAAVVSGHSTLVLAEPAGNRTAASVVPVLLWLVVQGSSDKLFNLSYGNPFPAGWVAVGSVNTDFTVDLAVPGTDKTVTLQSSIHVSAHADAMGSSALVPVVTPPRDLQLNGQDARVELSGVGGSPVVSWSAPASGGELSYSVSLYRLNRETTTLRRVAVLHTDGTSVTIPPVILKAGDWYNLRVFARPRDEFATNHKANPLEGGAAPAISGLFTP